MSRLVRMSATTDCPRARGTLSVTIAMTIGATNPTPKTRATSHHEAPLLRRAKRPPDSIAITKQSRPNIAALQAPNQAPNTEGAMMKNAMDITALRMNPRRNVHTQNPIRLMESSRF
jgi:hypothetical protein